VSVEKQSVAKRREPSWRVAATNGLMNLMEAPRYRVAGESRWRITEVKEEKRKRLVEREELQVTVVVVVIVVVVLVVDTLRASNSLRCR